MKEKKKPAWKRRLGRCVSLVLAAAVLAGVPSIRQPERVQAADLEMEINRDGNIEWSTTSRVGTSDIRFHTIGWQFTFYQYRDGSSKIDKSETVKKTVYLDDRDSITVHGSGSSATMRYTTKKDLQKYYGDDEGEDSHRYRIMADAIVEFRNHRTGKQLAVVRDRETAESTARKYGMGRGPYFTNYYNRVVNTDKNYLLKATCDTGLENPSIDGVTGQKRKVSRWVTKGDRPQLAVDAKTDTNGNKGYVFKDATHAEKMRTTSSQGGRGPADEVTKNTTVKMTSVPLRVTVTYHINGESIGSQTFEYGKTSSFGDKPELNYFTDYQIDKWYTGKDGKSGTSYNKLQSVGNKTVIKLFGKWKNTNTPSVDNLHKVDLYATAEEDDINPPPGGSHDYTIIYKGNGATSGTMKPQAAEYEKNVMLQSIRYKKEGYHTDAADTWKTKKNKKSYKNCMTVSSRTVDFDDGTKKTVTLSANWKPNTCTIIYSGNGATDGYVGDQKITYDKWTQKVKDNSYTKNGKHPGEYWNTKPDGSGVSVKAGTKIDKALWTRLFGSADKNKVTITLYAQWNGKPGPSGDIPEIGDGDLVYRAGETGGNGENGPHGYTMDGSVTFKECMFGELYTEDTPKIQTYETGYRDIVEEQDYLIRAGSHIAEKNDRYFKFTGWSVDRNAVWAKSQAVISSPNTKTGGKNLAFLYYGYLNPVKANPAWEKAGDTTPVPRPVTVILSPDAARRADELTASRNAWLKYEELVRGDITRLEQEVEKQKGLVEKYGALYASALASYNSLSAPSWPGDRASQSAKDSYYSSLSSYHSSRSYYSGLMDSYRAQQKKHRELQAKAEAELDTEKGILSDFNASVTHAIRVAAGTYVYAVWDQFPEFVGMDEIAINEAKIDQVTDEWLYRYVHVYDREDGELENGKDVVVENFDKSELRKIQHTGSVSVTFRATDSAGNVTRYTTNIWVNDKDPLEPGDLEGKLYYEAGDTRFINREFYEIGDPQSGSYYGQGYDGLTTREDGTKVPVYLYVGGLHPESRWYHDPEWRSSIYRMFENEENNTPEEVWEFSHQDILDIQQFIDEHGIGDMEHVGSLDLFYDRFSRCRTHCSVSPYE